MKVLTIIAMLLQYIAFFFAIPELLGEGRLKLLNGWVKNIISYLPRIAIGILSTLAGLVMAFWGSNISNTSNSFYIKIFYVTVIGSLIMVIILAIFQKQIIIFLNDRVAQPIIIKLNQSSDYRLRALKIAALLYSIGLVILIFSTIYF